MTTATTSNLTSADMATLYGHRPSSSGYRECDVMTDKIQQARREMFEAWAKSEHGDLTRRQDDEYFSDLTHGAWLGFNAALDLAVIELPEPHSTNGGDYVVDFEECRAAIESTNLGLKII